jgi:hypothetical protein
MSTERLTTQLTELEGIPVLLNKKTIFRSLVASLPTCCRVGLLVSALTLNGLGILATFAFAGRLHSSAFGSVARHRGGNSK